MLKMIACAEWPGEPAGYTERPHELKWPTEVLRAELIIAQEGPTATHINRDEPVLPSKSKVERHKSEDRVVLPCTTEHPGRGQQSGSKDPAGCNFPLPGKSSGKGHIGLRKIDFLLFPYRRAAAETAS